MQTNPGKRVSSPPAAASDLPSIARILETAAFRKLARESGRPLTVELLREAIGALRERIRAGEIDAAELRRATTPQALAGAVRKQARELLASRPRPVINATGIVVHTNLGRSLLSAEAAQAVAESARSYVDLEYDVAAGGRGSRLSQLEPLMSRLFPGHGFLVVNNNAAAIMLALRALAKGKEVVISRGELVEIGGSFRVPDILAASGAKLKEVGTTNRTRLADYREAHSRKTGAVLKVHTSNFRIVGFTESTKISSLSRWCRKADVPLIVDWGSGDLVDLEPLGIRDEDPIGAVLAAGADLVTFSGDKLLGGPQAGFVVGRREMIERLRKDPLARVCRLDRLLIAALHSTLAAYVRGDEMEQVPTLRMLALEPAAIEKRARRVIQSAVRRTGLKGRLEIVDGVSRTGGGSSPIGERPTRLIAVSGKSGDAGSIEERLRCGGLPVIGRIAEGRLLLDLRTVAEDADLEVARRLSDALAADGE